MDTLSPTFISDIPTILQWWSFLFLIGAAAYPFTRRLFFSWWDQGYLFSKAVGLLCVSLFVWQLGSFKILPYNQFTIILGVVILFFSGLALSLVYKKKSNIQWTRLILLEFFFFSCLFFWSFIKGHEADIRSLEKFMDYGFSAAIQQSSFFPPPDMWYAGGTINYYYFGHLTQSILSTFSGISLTYGYNLMLATLFAFCFTMSFSIGIHLWLTHERINKKIVIAGKKRYIPILFCGVLSAFLVTLSGNMQTIYAFTQGYSGENPVPFWNLFWQASEFMQKLPVGLQNYWYANATRFIPFTIHEFPAYSFVVSDNHGHVFSIPFVLLMIAGFLNFFGRDKKTEIEVHMKHILASIVPYMLFGSMIGILLMTNALDGPIYGAICIVLLFSMSTRGSWFSYSWVKEKVLGGVAILGGFIFTALPFLLNFKSFATGLAINCPPMWFQERSIGPFLFETIDKCQKSPFWMMWLLWGFFWFCGIVFITTLVQKKRTVALPLLYSFYLNLKPFYRVLLVLFFSSVCLIFFAEFFYFKDIYPAHFRSNTMFKLGYQAFIYCSLLSAFVITRICFTKVKNYLKIFRLLFIILVVPQLFLVSIFPLFAVRSYFGNLEQYKGLYGLQWLQREYPSDYEAYTWLNARINAVRPYAQKSTNNWLRILSQRDAFVRSSFFTKHIADIPVILEADGDSYTDYNRFSAFSGLPTVIGWGVHEWLWRGSYDVVAPRKEEVRELYETDDTNKVRELLSKYNIKYVVIGSLERQKFENINIEHFDFFGTKVFESGATIIYAIDK